MKYYNLDVRINAGTDYHERGEVYQVSAYFSEGGEAHSHVHFPFSEQVRGTNTVTSFPLNEAALKQQLEQIEWHLYRGSDEDKRSSLDREQLMQSLGQSLFDTLFSGRIRDLFNKAVNSLNEEREERLRIRLCIQPPELVALPWEFLYWSDVDDFLCLDRRYSVVRYQDLPVLFGPLKVELPLRIFGMISLPNDQPKIDATQEKNLIKKGIKASGKENFILQWGANGTANELRQNMSNHNWHVFHYIGSEHS